MPGLWGLGFLIYRPEVVIIGSWDLLRLYVESSNQDLVLNAHLVNMKHSGYCSLTECRITGHFLIGALNVWTKKEVCQSTQSFA